MKSLDESDYVTFESGRIDIVRSSVFFVARNKMSGSMYSNEGASAYKRFLANESAVQRSKNAVRVVLREARSCSRKFSSV